MALRGVVIMISGQCSANVITNVLYCAALHSGTLSPVGLPALLLCWIPLLTLKVEIFFYFFKALAYEC